MVYNGKIFRFYLKFYYVIKLQWQRNNYDTENKLGFVFHTGRTYVYETNITEFTIQYRRSQNFFSPPLKYPWRNLPHSPLGLDAPAIHTRWPREKKEKLPRCWFTGWIDGYSYLFLVSKTAQSFWDMLNKHNLLCTLFLQLDMCPR